MGTGSLKRLAGSYAVARPPQALPVCPALEGMVGAPLVALAAPCDFIALDQVAALITERYAEVIWIRLEAADADPGSLLIALTDALAPSRTTEADALDETVARWGRRGEWWHAYRLLGDVLGAAVAPPAIMVLEGAEHLGKGSPAILDLFVSALFPTLQDNVDILFIGFTEWNSRRLDAHGQVLGPRQLRLDQRSAALVAEVLCFDPPAEAFARSFALARGAAAALGAAYSAGAVLGPEAFALATARARTVPELLEGLCRSLLAQSNEDTLTALAGACRLGVWHPSIGIALGYGAPRSGEPWWLDLADGWRQLMPTWRGPLQSTRGDASFGSSSLTRLAHYLARQGVGVRAFELFLEAGELDCAVDIAVSLMGELASAGCWTTISRLVHELGHRREASGRSFEPHDFAGPPSRRKWWRRPSRNPVPAQSLDARRMPEAAPPGLLFEAADRTGLGLTSPKREASPIITVHLLGELQVAFGDSAVKAWASGRGRAVFEYLVIHRHNRVQRDRLMTTFWPGASPEAARNSLNVAIHGLRRTLRTVARDRPIVIHQDGAYFIDPAWDVWVDAEVFEDRLKSAHQHLIREEPARAKTEFEAAIELYRGEFLADDPYEEWALVTREQLRLSYLDCLDQLSRLRLSSGDYSGCIEVCSKILEYDNCREDAHRRLMRSYSRQGQVQLALRQYHTCAAILRRELQLSPAPATTELFNRIRQRQEV
jgi:DNA-binding SARP family transcriptional activator